jgi:uncharacterized surface protein with fasciclin (FAS1) repeats
MDALSYSRYTIVIGMKEDTYVWAWVSGSALLIVLILGSWWWHANRGPAEYAVNYDTTTVADEALQSPNSPTLPVPLETLPQTVAAKGTKSTPSNTVAGVVAVLPDATRFAALLVSTGVSAQLSGKGPYTLFVPTDTSFKLLPPGSLDLSAAQLKRLVEYHIVAGKELNINAETTGIEQALSGDMLNLSVFPSDQSARINSAVALKEFKTSNGVIYLVSEVLLPPINPQ